MGRKNHRQRTFTQSRYAARAASANSTNTKNIRLSHMTGKWAERTTGRGRSPRAGTLPASASANSRNTKNIRLSHRTGNGQKEPPAEEVHPEQVRCPRRHLPTAGIQRTYDCHTEQEMGRKNHGPRTFTQSRYAARAGICQQLEYKEHKIVTQDWKWAERTTGLGRSPRAGTLPAPASANSWNTKNIRLSHRTGNWQKEPRAEDVHPEQVRCPRRHLPTAGIQRTYDCHTGLEMGRKNHGPRTFAQCRYAARAGICQQLEYKEHTIVTQDWKWAERTTGRGRSPRAGTLPAPASANSRNTKNIRLSHRTGNGQKEPPAEDVHPEQVRCPRRHLPTAGIQRTYDCHTGLEMGRKNHRQRTFTQSRYAARAGICQQLEYKEHTIVTQDWKWAERTTGLGRSPRAGTLPAPASANSRNTNNIRLSHRTGNGQKEPPAEDVHPEQVRCPRRHLPTAGIQRISRLSHGRTEKWV